jgi:hypothetical protein
MLMQQPLRCDLFVRCLTRHHVLPVHVAPLPQIQTSDTATEALLLDALSSLFSTCGEMFCTHFPSLHSFFYVRFSVTS